MKDNRQLWRLFLNNRTRKNVKTKSAMKPNTFLSILAPIVAFLPFAASAQNGYQRDYEQAEFYEDYYPNHVEKRGPIRNFFRDVAGEVRYQREHFWDDMRDLKQDVRRAIRNETPAEKNAREAAQYREAEQRFANRFGYRGESLPQNTTQRPNTYPSVPADSSRPATTDVPMDDRFFAHEPPASQRPVYQNRPANPSPTGNAPVTIVRPTPPVGSDLPASPNNPVAPPTETTSTATTSQTQSRANVENVPVERKTTQTKPEQSKPKEEPAPKKDTAKTEKEEIAKQYPVATKTSREGIVLSPFAPHDELDVTGMKSGDFAMDPGNGRIFRVP